MRDAMEHNPSRLAQVNLVVPGLCHMGAYDGVLKEVLMVQMKKIAAGGLGEAVKLLESVFGKGSPKYFTMMYTTNC